MRKSLYQQHKYLNIVSNTCIGGFCYAILGINPQNPFIWSTIFPEDFLCLLENFSKIDLLNVKSFADEGCYGILLDNKVKVYFTHHKRDAHVLQPTRIGTDIYCNDVEKYLVDKWKHRAMICKLHMLQHLLELPSFVAVHTTAWTCNDIERLTAISNCRITFMTNDESYAKLQNSNFKTLYVKQPNNYAENMQYKYAKIFLTASNIDVQNDFIDYI